MINLMEHISLKTPIFFFVTLNSFQGLQFEGVKKHPLNAPPKNKRGDAEASSA